MFTENNNQTDRCSTLVLGPRSQKSLAELVNEIASFTREPEGTVRERLWEEVFASGTNVIREAERLGVTPHVFNDAMLRLYKEGDGFIYETLVYWQNRHRVQWTERAIQRIRLYSQRNSVPEPRVLILGDGTGSDSLYLWRAGIHADYFDYPGSRTYEFAMHRFERHGVKVRCLSADQLRAANYDAVLCFEVLEHMPDPYDGIRTIRESLKPNGIALVTEAFGAVTGNRPTHLACNLRYAHKTPFMFFSAGLTPSWLVRPWKPMEFTKRKGLIPASAFTFAGLVLAKRAMGW